MMRFLFLVEKHLAGTVQDGSGDRDDIARGNIPYEPSGISELHQLRTCNSAFSAAEQLKLSALDVAFKCAARRDDNKCRGFYISFEVAVYAYGFFCLNIALEPCLSTDNGLYSL